MSHFGSFALILFAIIAMHEVQSECSSVECKSDVCNDVCSNWLMTGKCVDNECRCSTGKICDAACDNFCDSFELGLEGECDENGMCTCKPKLEFCSAIDCQIPCEEDPRARQCLFVVADSCLMYGKVQTCVCICYTWFNQFNHLIPAKAKKLLSFSNKFIPKKSSQFNRNFYSIVRPEN